MSKAANKFVALVLGGGKKPELNYFLKISETLEGITDLDLLHEIAVRLESYPAESPANNGWVQTATRMAKLFLRQVQDEVFPDDSHITEAAAKYFDSPSLAALLLKHAECALSHGKGGQNADKLSLVINVAKISQNKKGKQYSGLYLNDLAARAARAGGKKPRRDGEI